MSSFKIRNSDSRIYVGNLAPSVRTKGIEEVFSKYGCIRDIDLKIRRGGTSFAFIEFQKASDAEAAVKGRDGYTFHGYRLRVQFPKTQMCRYGPTPRRTEHRVMVSVLPATASWQDLKDYMRKAGEVCYADILRDGTGVVEFERSEDVYHAVRKLDNTKFRSHEGESSYIRVKMERPFNPSYSRSCSRSKSRSQSSTFYRRGSPRYTPPRYTPPYTRIEPRT